MQSWGYVAGNEVQAEMTVWSIRDLRYDELMSWWRFLASMICTEYLNNGERTKFKLTQLFIKVEAQGKVYMLITVRYKQCVWSCIAYQLIGISSYLSQSPTLHNKKLQSRGKNCFEYTMNIYVSQCPYVHAFIYS